MMRFTKKAFSLTEILMVLIAIGIISTIHMKIFHEKINQYGAPYYNTYNFLRRAAYNILADPYCPNPSSDDVNCRTNVRHFPVNSVDLCKRMTEFLNTTGDVHCGTLDKNANSDRDINDNASNIGPNTQRFTISNGSKVYLSGLKTIDINNGEDAPNDKTTVNYFVVYVDLNGNKAPNRIECNTSDTLPDIVPFAITTRGELIPMGLPMYSKKYMSAYIRYPDEVHNGEIINTSSKGMNFYSAVVGAWPNSSIADRTTPFQYIDMPYTYLIDNDTRYRNSNIRSCYTTDRELEEHTGEPKIEQDTDTRAKGCVGGTYNCRIIVEKYRENRL